MKGWIRVGLRIPPEINTAWEKAAKEDYMTKNQKASEIFRNWLAKKETEASGRAV
jgi:hypothetical protein